MHHGFERFGRCDVGMDDAKTNADLQVRETDHVIFLPHKYICIEHVHHMYKSSVRCPNAASRLYF